MRQNITNHEKSLPKLDLKDRKILRELDMDATMPLNELAKKLKISRYVAEYRIKRMLKEKIISLPYVVTDSAVVGVRWFRVLFRLKNVDEQKKKEIISYFASLDSTIWVASIGNKWDVIINFMALDSFEFNSIFEEIIIHYGKFIHGYEILTYIDIHDNEREYILPEYNKEMHGNKPKKVFFHEMKHNQEIKLDETDKSIIDLLSKNAWLSYTEIAHKLTISRNTVKYRLEQHRKNKVILGSRLMIHPSALGYQSYMLFLDIHNLTPEREKVLQEFAKNKQNIIYVVKHIGRYRIGFECEVQDQKEFQKLLVETRDKFEDIISDYEIFPIFYDHKINYFPMIGRLIYGEDNPKLKK
ncbi:AsnC family transcriptional regulator [Candidatus Woesearchaeota archaeon]|nr:AsnC family transcriptional regulator [Candidatus Woesearchaeota archaeon]